MEESISMQEFLDTSDNFEKDVMEDIMKHEAELNDISKIIDELDEQYNYFVDKNMNSDQKYYEQCALIVDFYEKMASKLDNSVIDNKKKVIINDLIDKIIEYVKTNNMFEKFSIEYTKIKTIVLPTDYAHGDVEYDDGSIKEDENIVEI